MRSRRASESCGPGSIRLAGTTRERHSARRRWGNGYRNREETEGFGGSWSTKRRPIKPPHQEVGGHGSSTLSVCARTLCVDSIKMCLFALKETLLSTFADCARTAAQYTSTWLESARTKAHYPSTLASSALPKAGDRHSVVVVRSFSHPYPTSQHQKVTIQRVDPIPRPVSLLKEAPYPRSGEPMRPETSVTGGNQRPSSGACQRAEPIRPI